MRWVVAQIKLSCIDKWSWCSALEQMFDCVQERRRKTWNLRRYEWFFLDLSLGISPKQCFFLGTMTHTIPDISGPIPHIPYDRRYAFSARHQWQGWAKKLEIFNFFKYIKYIDFQNIFNKKWQDLNGKGELQYLEIFKIFMFFKYLKCINF